MATPVNKNGQTLKMQVALLTDIGEALFVSYPNASQFDDSKMEASIRVTEAQKDAFVAKLEPFIQASCDALKVDRSKIELPVKPSHDKEGSPDGKWIIKSKTGIEYKPRVFNAANVEIHPDSIANGSTIRLKVSAAFTNSPKFKGISLRLGGIQVIQAREFDSGFDVVEGYDNTASTSGFESSSTNEAWD